jgi:hypothetical protein
MIGVSVLGVCGVERAVGHSHEHQGIRDDEKHDTQVVNN